MGDTPSDGLPDTAAQQSTEREQQHAEREKAADRRERRADERDRRADLRDEAAGRRGHRADARDDFGQRVVDQEVAASEREARRAANNAQDADDQPGPRQS
ncbi:hypothetical protein [Streptomyces sp. NPDC018045]|uniref:hypothetical protein n=1 Tax=Streptomyces sp. NPDC018045 TaxID=3365037 RepID=UPI00378FD4CA